MATYAEVRASWEAEKPHARRWQARGSLITSDEKRRFRREVIARLGEGRLVTTAGLFVIAIRAGAIAVAEADQIKEILQRHRFRMAFRSFL